MAVAVAKVAILASGSGTNAERLIAAAQAAPDVEVVLVASNRAKAGVLNRADRLGIPTWNFRRAELESGAVTARLLDLGVEFVALAGFLMKVPDGLVAAYSGRMLNLHPALLPAFGGKGMYGMRVHRAVLASGAKLSGATVHLVNNEYDAGPIVAQQAVDVSACASAEEIAAAVLKVEHELFPSAIKQLIDMPHYVESNRVIFKG